MAASAPVTSIYRYLEHDVSIGSALRVRLWARREPAPLSGTAAHAGLEIAWVESGEIEYVVAGRRFPLHAGQAMVVPSGVEHRTSFSGAMRCGAMWIASDLAAEMAEAAGQRGSLEPGALAQPGTFAALAGALRREVTSPACGHLLAAESIAEAMMLSLLRGAPSRNLHAHARDPRVLAALDRMQADYGDPIGVSDLARAAGMSRFHFSRVFRDEVGESPYQHLLALRLDRAAELLRSGRQGATDVAFAVGIPDPSRFARMFRARFGVAPSSFRQRRATATTA